MAVAKSTDPRTGKVAYIGGAEVPRYLVNPRRDHYIVRRRVYPTGRVKFGVYDLWGECVRDFASEVTAHVMAKRMSDSGV